MAISRASYDADAWLGFLDLSVALSAPLSWAASRLQKPGLGFERPLPTFGDLDAFEEAGKCSALIKLLEDGSDIFIAQETWTSFDSMLRIYKMCTQPSP